jgi:hypothetical protein
MQVWYFRFSLTSVAVFYLVLALFLCRQYRTRPWGKVLYVAVLFAFFIGNGWRIHRLCTVGRGHYLEALRYMAEHTEGDTITISGDHDSSITTTLWLYRRYVPGKSVVYDLTRDPSRPAAWFIGTSVTPDDPPKPAVTMSGQVYRFEREYDCFVSCYRWFLYRRAAVGEPAPQT